jgi:hypothetical protein
MCRAVRVTGPGFFGKALAELGATQDASKRGEFAPFAEDALQWNQALEPLQAGQNHPVLVTFSALRNCSRSDNPHEALMATLRVGRNQRNAMKTSAEDCWLGGVVAGRNASGNWVIGYWSEPLR